MDEHRNVKQKLQINIGSSELWLSHSANLIVIHSADNLTATTESTNQEHTDRQSIYTIVNGNKSALQALEKSTKNLNQELIHQFFKLVGNLRAKGIEIPLH
jgi:hypothetical protein